MYSVKLRNWIVALLAAVCVLALTFAVASHFVFSNTESAMADATEISSLSDLTKEGEGEDAYYTLTSGNYIVTNDLALDVSIQIPAGETVSLDVNGNHISNDTESSVTSLFEVYGSFTIADTGITESEIATASIDTSLYSASYYLETSNYKSGSYIVYVEDGGYAEVDSGSYNCYTDVYLCTGSTAVFNGGSLYGESIIIVSEGSSAIINDGYYEPKDPDGIMSYGTLTVNGGYIVNNQESCLAIHGGDVYIYGGTIEASAQAIYLQNDSLYDEEVDFENLQYSTVTIGAEGLSDEAINLSSTGDCPVIMNNGCILNIYSGTITSSDENNAISVQYDSQEVKAYVNVYGGVITGSSSGIAVYGVEEYGVTAVSYAYVYISGGSITATGDESYGLCLEGSGLYEISGGEITGTSYGIYFEGVDDAASETLLAISGGTISATADTSAGLYINSAGACSVSGGDISGGIGIGIEKGTVEVSGGTISTTASSVDADSRNSIINSGVALYLKNTSSSDMDVTISGGTFVGTFGCVIALTGNDATSSSASTLTFTGGFFSSGLEDTDYCLHEYNTSYITVLIAGGHFCGSITEMDDMTLTGGSFTLCEEIFDLERFDQSSNLLITIDTQTVTIVTNVEDPYDDVLYTVTVTTCTSVVKLADVNAKYAADTTTVSYSSQEYTFGTALEGEGYTVTVTEGTGAGEYIVTLTCAEGTYFQQEDGTILIGNTVEFVYTIAQAATNNVTLSIASDGSYTSSADYGTIVYRYYSDAECTQEITGTITEPGTYYVRAEVDETSDYAGGVSEAVSFTINEATATDVLAVVAIIIILIGLAIALAIIFGHRRNRLEAAEAAASAAPAEASGITEDSTSASAAEATEATPETTEPAHEAAEPAEDNTLDEAAPADAEPVQTEDTPAEAPAADEPVQAEAAPEEEPAPATAESVAEPVPTPAPVEEPAGSVTIDVPDPNAVTIPARPKTN